MNERQRRFCVGIAAGEGQTEAYVNAGYKPGFTATVNASRLLTHANIKDEIKRLQVVVSARGEVTHEWLVQEQTKLYELATQKGDLNTARACLSEITKLNGHYAAIKTENKTEVTGDMNVNTNQIQDEAFAAIVKQARDGNTTPAVH